MLRLSVGLLAALALVTSCTTARQPQPEAGQRLRVFVTIPPQAYFVERVGGDQVSVQVLVPPGQSPHTYEPTPAQMAALESADVYFRIGVPMEQALVPKLQHGSARVRVVDTRQGITLRRMEDQHAGEGDDPHIWLDPKLVRIQARTICDALVNLDPQHADQYRANSDAFVTDLDALDAKLAAALAPLRGRQILVFHPSFGYFADAYGLRQVAIEVQGKEPSPRQLQQIIARARRERVKVIFVQPEFSARSAQAIAAELGATLVTLDPLSRDYLHNLEGIAGQIAGALQGQGVDHG